MAVRELNDNNLYRNGLIFQFSGGEQLLERDQLVLQGDLEDFYHTVRHEDRLDRIAYRFYKDLVPDSSKYWWVIADANEIENPLDLSEWVGVEILIPNIINVKLEL